MRYYSQPATLKGGLRIETRRINPEDLARLPGRALYTVSRGGDRIAYYSNHTGRAELYVLDLEDGTPVQATDGEAPRSIMAPFAWSHGDRHLIFAKDRDGDEHNNLFEVNATSKEVRQLTDDPETQDNIIDAFPDGSLLISSNRNGQVNLFRLSRSDGAWTQLTHFANPVQSAVVSPDGFRVAFNTNESSILTNMDGYIMDADGSNVTRVFRDQEGSDDAIVDWHPDGSCLLVMSDATGSTRLGALNLDTKEVLWLGAGGTEMMDGEFSPDGRHIIALENSQAELRPVLFEYPSGRRRDLHLPAGTANHASFALGSNHITIAYSLANRRGELLLYDLTHDTYRTLLPAEYGPIDPEVFVQNQHVTYPSADNHSVPAILYVPRDISAGTGVPAVIDVHGGPTGQYFRGFSPMAQLLVDQGFVVLQPNFRGSTGYGRAWREGNLMDWGGGDLEDVAAGVQYLSSLGIVDPSRIAIFGGSYGGYMTYMAAVKKPELFKVAIAWVGITDLHLLYEEDMEHFKYYLRTLMGDPQENRQLWQERSAITYADQLKARLLMVHGLNDPRCPIRQARNFRDRLISLGRTPGVDFDYVELPEGHGSGGDPTGTARMFAMVTDFLTENL